MVFEMYLSFMLLFQLRIFPQKMFWFHLLKCEGLLLCLVFYYND